MSYSQYAEFVDEEVQRLNSDATVRLPRIEGLDVDAVQALSLALRQELDMRRKDAFTPRNQDAVLAQIQNKEDTLLRQELDTVLALVGDLPRDRVGSNILELPLEKGFVSLERLLAEIRKLPQVALLDEHDTASEPLLREYNALRSTLSQKCHAIDLARQLLPQILQRNQTIRQLDQAVQQFHGTAVNDEYFRNYYSLLVASARDATQLLETALKQGRELTPSQLSALGKIVRALQDNL